MDDLSSQLESCYKKYINNITDWIPEGIQEIDLRLLQKFDLLDYHDRDYKNPNLNRYFQVLETSEKITLVNDQFIVWIVPEKVDETPITYALIALNDGGYPHLEIAFSASGVYNTSHLVLRVLEKFLMEIQETEDLISKYKKVS
jgi:hypothetical protein